MSTTISEIMGSLYDTSEEDGDSPAYDLNPVPVDVKPRILSDDDDDQIIRLRRPGSQGWRYFGLKMMK
jgi:hypothetical protein